MDDNITEVLSMNDYDLFIYLLSARMCASISLRTTFTYFFVKKVTAVFVDMLARTSPSHEASFY